MKGGKKRRRVSGTEEQGRDPLITATVQDRGEASDAAEGGAADLWQRGRTTQTICTTVQSSLDSDTDPPGCMVAGSWKTGLREQS